MSFQMMFFGNVASSQITGQAVSVEAGKLSGVSSASVTFRSNGQQTTERNGSTTTVGNWINPPASASEWEIRAILDSGDTPSGTLNTWLALTSDRSWTLSTATDGTMLQCELTFEFRRVGGSLPEATIAGSTLAAQVSGTPF